MARRLLGNVFVNLLACGPRALPACSVLLVCVLVGCVIPPPLEREDQDAALNSSPVLTGLDPRYPSPGPIAVSPDLEPMVLTVRDIDVGDTVWIYFYVDYNYPDPVPHLNSCQSAVSAIERPMNCPINALCAFDDGPPDQIHFLEAMITDRALLPDGEPLYRALPEGTGVSFRSWLMTCAESM